MQHLRESEGCAHVRPDGQNGGWRRVRAERDQTRFEEAGKNARRTRIRHQAGDGRHREWPTGLAISVVPHEDSWP